MDLPAGAVSSTVSSRQVAAPTTPVNISSQAYLDPACYVKGPNPLNIETGSVIHPRCRLYTDQGEVNIRAGSVLTERCVIGFDKDLNPVPESVVASVPVGLNRHITIGPNAYLQSSTKIQPPSTIGEGVLIEAGVILQSGCVVGAHSKVCAGVTLPQGTVVPEWTVVYGQNGRFRRKRQENATEYLRLDGMGRERQGMELLLRANAAKTLTSTAGSSRHGKRESVIRLDSNKS